MQLSYQQLQEVYARKDYRFFDTGVFNVNIFGIRSEDLLVDEFNDVLGLAYRDTFGNECLSLFKGTTKPGYYYLKHEMLNENGTSILIPGQYRSCWQLGFHKSYQALVQKGTGIFKVWRDNDSEGDLDYNGEVYTDVTGLNLHTTSFKNNIERVGKYSAGCQVIQDDLDFNMALSIILKSAERYGTTFSYTLLQESDF